MGEYQIHADDVPIRDSDINWQGWCEILFSIDDFHSRDGVTAHRVVVDESGGGDEDVSYQYLYAPADLVRRRLHVQGYTADRCRKLWERAASDAADRLRNLDLLEPLDSLPVDFNDWVSKRSRGKPSEYDPINLIDPMADLALHIDIFRPEAVWLDLTVSGIGDSFDRSQSLEINLSQDFDDADYINPVTRVLILTEGKTDTRILSSAIRQFYPEFQEFYQFMDFEGFKVEGSASALTRMVKAFASAKVRGSTLALFDNDVAGHIEKAHLDGIALPANMKTMTLPNLDFARSYPTLGPEGRRAMDVNGSACAIEMFLGQALRDPAGELQPVRWTAWKKELGRYQGEIDSKDAATSRFLEHIASGARPEDLRRDYPEMDILLNAIFEAFN